MARVEAVAREELVSTASIIRKCVIKHLPFLEERAFGHKGKPAHVGDPGPVKLAS